MGWKFKPVNIINSFKYLITRIQQLLHIQNTILHSSKDDKLFRINKL